MHVSYNVFMNIGVHHFLHQYKLAWKEYDQLKDKLTLKDCNLPDYQEISEDILVRNKKFRRFVNRSIYAIGVFGVLVIIPQIMKVWVERDLGVSLITWIGFFICALFWLLYGLVHKEKPIIYTNMAVLIADLMVISGLILLK